MRRLPVLASTALFLAWSGRAAEGQAPAEQFPVVASDTGAVMRRLADGVYSIVHARATEGWPHGNTGVIVGADGVLIIDSNYLPRRAVDDIALIRRVTSVPVRYLLNTHWHGDHTHGNGVYRDSFPGLTILGPRESAEFIELNLIKLPAGSAAEGSFNKTTLARLEALQARGSDSTGRALTTEERQALATNIGERRHEIAELARVKVAPPNLVFERQLSLDLGGRRVEIRNMGRANSPADVIAYLPAERVLFAGDIVVHPLPYTSGAWPLPWLQVLRELESYPVTALVPGHGPVMANHEYTRLVRETLDLVRGQIDSLYRRGLRLDAAAQAVDISGQRLKFRLTDGRPVGPISWEGFTRSVATSMAECVHGYRC